MSRCRASTLAAVVGFILVAIVVLGGMTWATVSTFQLAKINVDREHHTRMSGAATRIDSHVGGILKSEMARPFTQYFAYYTVAPVQVWTDRAIEAEVNIDQVVLPSPLAEPPLHDPWIEFYFQVDEDGNWRSPETRPAERVAARLAWLEDVLPVGELAERVAKVRQRDRGSNETPDAPQQPQEIKLAQRTPHKILCRCGDRDCCVEYERRGQDKRAAQLRSLPESQCVNPDHGAEDIADIAAVDGDSDSESETVTVGIEQHPWVAFWLEPDATERSRLAFVRTGHWNDKRVYQGFIGDWPTLKHELQLKISDLFDDVDLQPAPDDAPPDPELSNITMHTIPVRLEIPGVTEESTAAAAWKSIRGVLLVTWATAAAVLIVAGIGFRNLIALTQRRMQFAYAVTHELRTPLTTFRLYSDMLSAGLVPDESKQEYLDTLNRESLRLSNLVEGVLEYARLENHKVSLNVADTDAKSLLRAISDGLEKRCQECGIEPRAQNDVSDSLPLRTDVDVVKQISGVLINNACRHTQGTDKPVVFVHLAQDDGKVHLDVVDSGPGVSHGDVRRIFKPFRRGREADSAAQGGIGLGLALARSWAGLLGGRLELMTGHHNELGGAHFRLIIPVQARG
ncbi:MAG: HAMP domain-containing histidine kinase [Phycisphaerales bacterium]|nr:MAG: HAMP domain-containing histidine kinase [Phycisphaerales bacterium]